MKKIVCLAMLLCCMSMTTVHAQSSSKKFSSTEEIMKHLEGLVEKFCHYVEVIGSTESVSQADKNRMRRQEVPELFYRYNERKMVTTAGAKGTIQSRKKMADYFRNLQTQSQSQSNLRNRTNVLYDLEFVFAGNVDGNLNWDYIKTHEDGTKEYEAKVMIYQTYMKETLTGYEVIRSRREVDKKEMAIKKLVLPTSNEVYKLGDITRAERLETAVR